MSKAYVVHLYHLCSVAVWKCKWISELSLTPDRAEAAVPAVARPVEPSAVNSIQQYGPSGPCCFLLVCKHLLRSSSKFVARRRMLYQVVACNTEMDACPTLESSVQLKVVTGSIHKSTTNYLEVSWDSIWYCNKISNKLVFMFLAGWFGMRERWTVLRIYVCNVCALLFHGSSLIALFLLHCGSFVCLQ